MRTFVHPKYAPTVVHVAPIPSPITPSTALLGKSLEHPGRSDARFAVCLHLYLPRTLRHEFQIFGNRQKVTHTMPPRRSQYTYQSLLSYQSTLRRGACSWPQHSRTMGLDPEVLVWFWAPKTLQHGPISSVLDPPNQGYKT